MIKFNKSLSDFQYCLSFDLAKHLTGWSFVDIINHKILLTGEIDTTKANTICPWTWFLTEIKDIISQCKNLIGPENESKMFITKEQLPCQAGPHTTIQALQALAQAHSTCDIAIDLSGIETYDDKGVHAASVKAYYKRKTELEKPSKEDIRQDIIASYGGIDALKYIYTCDISDSIAVIETILHSKWNNDIQEEIKVTKRERKSAVSQAKIEKLSDYIDKLEALKLPES